jgi:thiol-disulfide isomerase/thioredoxin
MMTLLDQFSFHHVLAETPGPALVIFTAPHCGSCRAMRKALAIFVASHPEVSLFEVDAQRDMALTREFEVFHLPALFLYVGGRFHGEIQCEPLPHRLERSVATAMTLPAQEAP